MRSLGWLRVVAINVVLLLLFGELAAVTLYYVQHGQLFYTRPVAQASVAGAPNGAPNVRIAPYFGFMWAPGLAARQLVEPERLARMAAPEVAPAWTQIRTNNYGFLSAHDYPFVASNAKAFVIGIFGGSVAQWFALQGAAPLIATLASAPAYRGRDIVVLDLASAGYKQPQQLLALDYFTTRGQRLDYVVNIDGFNEVALAGINAASGIDAAMPSAQHMLPLAALVALNPESDTLERVGELAEARRETAARRTARAGRTFALAYLADDLQLRLLARRTEALAKTIGKTQSLSLVSLVGASPASTVPPAGEAVAIWSRAALRMSQALAASRTGYLEVIQPNQYFGGKALTVEEQRIAINAASPYRAHVERGYPELLAAVPGLRAAGLQVLDATRLFDAERETVYADDCCHYNQRGNDALARAIAQAIIANPAPGSSR